MVRDSGGLGDFERLILQQAVAVVALELMRRRVARETERRLAGDVLAGALGGRLDPSELQRRLEPFGIGEQAAVLVFDLDDPAAAEHALERALAADACPAVVAPHSSGSRELLCAVVDAADRDPIDLASEARKALIKERGAVRAAASRPAPPEELRHSFHEARCALEATAFAENGSEPEVASWRDLGAFTLLLSIQDDDALGLYCDSVLGPIEAGDEEYGGELLRSLEAFIEQNGQWERAARQVYCHRHTLRYRMRKVEELTGRDLSRAHDRIEFWLALRARELVG
jgi:purine catabolism regulator